MSKPTGTLKGVGALLMAAMTVPACYGVTAVDESRPGSEFRQVSLGGRNVADVARARATLDFGCPAAQVQLKPVAQLTVDGARQLIFLAHGCGHDARYCCMDWEYTHCVREPLDDEQRQPRDPGRLMP